MSFHLKSVILPFHLKVVISWWTKINFWKSSSGQSRNPLLIIIEWIRLANFRLSRESLISKYCLSVLIVQSILFFQLKSFKTLVINFKLCHYQNKADMFSFGGNIDSIGKQIMFLLSQYEFVFWRKHPCGRPAVNGLIQLPPPCWLLAQSMIFVFIVDFCWLLLTIIEYSIFNNSQQ